MFIQLPATEAAGVALRVIGSFDSCSRDSTVVLMRMLMLRQLRGTAFPNPHFFHTSTPSFHTPTRGERTSHQPSLSCCRVSSRSCWPHIGGLSGPAFRELSARHRFAPASFSCGWRRCGVGRCSRGSHGDGLMCLALSHCREIAASPPFWQSGP